MYSLPSKNNIDKNIDKQINKICKKNKIYNDFKDYFIETWSKYFRDKTLVLKDIDKKIRTNNSIENFNRNFKERFEQKNNIDIVIYVDNLITISKEIKNYYIEQINKPSKKISNNKLANINKGKYIDEDYKEIMQYLDEINEGVVNSNKNIVLEKNKVDFNNQNVEINSNLYENFSEEAEEDNSLNKTNLNKTCFLSWNNNSCSFDSFIAAFYYSILPNINNTKIHKHLLNDINKNKDYSLYISFIEFIYNNIRDSKLKLYFYNLYSDFNTINNCDLFELDKNL